MERTIERTDKLNNILCATDQGKCSLHVNLNRSNSRTSSRGKILNLEATGKLTIRSLRAKPLQVIQLERKRLLQDKIFTCDIFCAFDYRLQILYSTYLWNRTDPLHVWIFLFYLKCQRNGRHSKLVLIRGSMSRGTTALIVLNSRFTRNAACNISATVPLGAYLKWNCKKQIFVLSCLNLNRKS